MWLLLRSWRMPPVYALAVVAAWGLAMVSGDAAAEDESSPFGGTEVQRDPASPSQPAATPEAGLENRKRNKMVAEFMRRLGRFKPYGENSKKDISDCYLVATADIVTNTQSADVRFSVVAGQKETAEFLVDYILGAPPKTLRKWHVFARFKDETVANQGLAMARTRYDQMVAYRQQLQKIYAVQSTRRC